MGRRSRARPTGCAIQSLRLGPWYNPLLTQRGPLLTNSPRRNLRRRPPKPSLHRRTTHRPRPPPPLPLPKSALRPPHRLRPLRLGALGTLPLLPLLLALLAPQRHNLAPNNSLLPRLPRLLLRLPPKRALPHSPRPRAAPPPRASHEPARSRYFVRVPQSPTRVARIHRIPPLSPPTPRHRALASLALTYLAPRLFSLQCLRCASRNQARAASSSP